MDQVPLITLIPSYLVQSTKVQRRGQGKETFVEFKKKKEILLDLTPTGALPINADEIKHFSSKGHHRKEESEPYSVGAFIFR